MIKSSLRVKVFVTLLLLSGMAWLTKVGAADFLRLEPCIYIDALGKGAVRLEPNELDKARERLLLARSWDASNPLIPEYLAQTDFMLMQLVNFSPAIQAAFLRNAIVNLNSAISLRPNSAYLWAARMTAGSWLVELKAQTDESVDKSEFELISMAMRRAAVLDPWNPSVLQQIVKVGTLRNKELFDEDRLIVEQAKIRARQLNITI